MSEWDAFPTAPAGAATKSEWDAFPATIGGNDHGGVASTIKQVGVGFNEAVADTAGMPVDATTWLLNRIPGVDIKNPVGGSASIKSAMGLVGDNPDEIPANTTPEKIARGAGGGVATMLVPETTLASFERAGMKVAPRVAEVLKSTFGGADSAASVAGNAAIGAASGGAGTAAGEAAPEPYKPIARFAGGLAAGVGAAGAAGAVRKAADAVGTYAAPLTESWREGIAADTLARSATDPNAAREALGDDSADIVPGSSPTTFQVTGDMGLGALERDVATKNPAEFNQRRAEQNLARNSALQRMQETGSPADVSNFLRTELRSIDTSSEEAVNRATDEARTGAAAIGGDGSQESYGERIRGAAEPRLQAATDAARAPVEALGGAGSPEGYGATMRGSLSEARAASKQQERALWNAVDPDGTLSLPVDRVRQAADGLEQNLSQSAKPIAGEERAIIDVIKGYDAVAPFQEITDLRSRISTAMREELRTAGETAVYGRLRRLRGAVEDAIGSAVEERTAKDSEAVARGEMSPEQTVAAMLTRFAAKKDAWLAQRAQDARTGDGGPDVRSAASSSPVVPATPGARGEGGGRLSGNAGDQSLPEAPLQPNFDAAAQERLRAATTATRERKQTFDSGPVGNVLRSAGMQGQYRLADAAVPATVFKPGPGGFQAVQAFRRAAGDTAALNILHDYAAASMRRAAERPDGSIDATRYVAWRRQHQDALRGIPGLVQQFDAAARASEPLAAFRPLSPEISAAHVPESFFHAGTGGFEDVARLRQLIGDEHANLILGDYAASRLRQTAIKADGTLDPVRFESWRRQHADALRALPQLETRFSSAARAAEAIGEVAANRKAALDAYQQGVFGRLVGVQDPQDITRVIGGLFGQRNAVAEMRRLALATENDQAARAGLRKAIVDHIANKFVSNTEAATSGAGLIKSDAFQSFVRQNEQALRQVFSSEEVSSLHAIAADLRRANRSITAVKIPGGSNTAQDQAAQQVSLLRMIMRHSINASVGAGAGFSLGGPLGSLIGVIGGTAVSGMRDAGLKKVDDLLKSAMLDPNVARILLNRAGARPDKGAGLQLAKYMRRVIGSTLFQQANGAQNKPVATGERHSAVELDSPLAVAQAAERTVQPTPAQAEAGNARKRHVRWKGLDISVETEAGQERTGIGRDGKTWSVTMAHPYGYVKGTVGRDGEQADIYIGPHPQVQTAFVFDQIDPGNGKFDEHKIVVGARDLNEARQIYDSGFSDGSGQQRRGAAREMSVAELKQWLENGDMKKPVAYEDQSARPRTKRPVFTIRPTFAQLLKDKRPAQEIRAELEQQGLLS